MTEKTMMPAWSRGTYGSADGVRLVSVPVPQPDRDEVVLRVRASALNAGDVRLMLGDPLLVRPMFGLTRPRFPVRGIEAVGDIVALGDRASGFAAGDRVVAELVGGGGLAGFVRVPVSRLVRVPDGVSDVAAVTLPVAGGTAWQALDAAGLGEVVPAGVDRRVLIIGASGGVGTFAVQLAALRGAEVWATCSARNAEAVQHLGAARTIDHRTAPLAELPAARFDAVIDIAGGMPLRTLQRLVRGGGAVVLVAGDGGPVLGPVPRMLKAVFASLGSHPRVRPLAATPRTGVLAALLDLADRGRITPLIEREYPFAEADAALAHIEAGHTVGKVVVLGP